MGCSEDIKSQNNVWHHGQSNVISWMHEGQAAGQKLDCSLPGLWRRDSSLQPLFSHWRLSEGSWEVLCQGHCFPASWKCRMVCVFPGVFGGHTAFRSPGSKGPFWHAIEVHLEERKRLGRYPIGILTPCLPTLENCASTLAWKSWTTQHSSCPGFWRRNPSHLSHIPRKWWLLKPLALWFWRARHT